MADALTPPAPGLPATLAAPFGGAQNIFERIQGFARQPAVAKSIPTLLLIGLLGLAALAWSVLHQPPQRTLFAGMADGDKAAVADALGSAGIAYTIDRDTGGLTVADGQFYQAKMLLAQQGLPKSAPDGDAMISNLPLGSSRAVENERLGAAREADLARTIEAIDAVEDAKVHLAAPQSSVFLRDDAKPSASVMLRLRNGRALSSAQVQAIIHLVASSVPGLTPDNVSVVDQTGDLLSKAGGDAGDDVTDKQVAMQTKVEDRYRQSLMSLLAPIVGADNFTAEVHADLDFAQVASTKETYPKDPAPVAVEQGSWSDDAGDGAKGPGGIPGALSNQPPQAGQLASNTTNKAGQAPQGPSAPGQAPGQASAGAASKTTESYNRTYQLGREVSVTQNQVGTVRRLTVAVALRDPAGKKRTPQEIQALDALVKGAVGFDQARGDVVAISSRAFEATAADAEKLSWYEAPWVGMVGRNVGAVVVVLILVFGLGRPLLKRRSAAAAAFEQERSVRRAEMGKHIAQALSGAQNGAPSPQGRITLDMIESAPGYAARADLIRNFVKQDPDRAALVVRDLIRSDMPGAEKE